MSEAQGPRLRQGVAPDRTLSVLDAELRWGHKSSQQRWAGYSAATARPRLPA